MAGAYSGPLRVIDLPSNSETWYQVANPSTLLKRMVRHPYLTLMDAHHRVHGTIFPTQASPAGADLSLLSLVPYYPPLPDASTPPVDRAAFGSDALTRFLRVVPDSFPVHPPVVPPLPDEFRLVYFNVNGLDGFKFAELLLFMAIKSVDCMWCLLMSVSPPHASLFYVVKLGRNWALVPSVWSPLLFCQRSGIRGFPSQWGATPSFSTTGVGSSTCPLQIRSVPPQCG